MSGSPDISASFCIGQSPIGPDAPSYVIAEAGVNHNGSLARAREMAHAAADAGADAVKFQYFSAEALTTRDAPSAAYQLARSQRELLAGLELTGEDFADLAEECRKADVAMLLTPFGPAQVAAVTRLGLPAIKLASPDVTNVPLLQAAGRTSLPIILSTGAATLEEIASALDCLVAAGGGPVALLHCVSSYPTPLGQANLRCVAALAGRFGRPTGFSDHTVETVTGALAVGVGACILEKHFTLDRRLPGPDHALSLTPAELAEYIRLARAARRGAFDEAALPAEQRAALGDGCKAPQAIELEVRRVARSSVTAAVDIAAGTRIERAMLTVKRPGGGLPPSQIDALPGRVAAVDIPADTTLFADMLR